MSAHELRTPIAGALAQAQQLSEELGDLPQGARVQSVETALKKLSSLSENLLQLARLDAGFARADRTTDLMPVLNLILRDTDRVELTLDPEADLHLAVNPDAFSILVGNLLQNALNHGGRTSQVAVTVGPHKRISVANAGPVVAPETLNRLGQKFVRGTTRSQGTGLGLALVKSIMEQTGGKTRFISPRSGDRDGFEVVLEWP